MAEPDHTFLTESRREILNGESDWEDSSVAVEKSRIKNRAETALNELIEVAKSPEIDHTDVFEEDTVFRLLRSLMLPTHRMDEIGTGLIDRDDYPDDFQQYSDRLQTQMAKLVLEDQYGEE